MKRKSKLFYCSTESWHYAESQCSRYSRKSSRRSKAENYLVSNAGGPPLKGTRIKMYVAECYRLILCKLIYETRVVSRVITRP